MIRVQTQDFDIGAELSRLLEDNKKIGALVTFTGLVRDLTGDKSIDTMTLEHYPGMTERELGRIEAEAHRRWPLDASLIIHRTGALRPGDRIVLVVTASAHRHAAFEANAFLVDWLKTKAPFWKWETGPDGGDWVSARTEDQAAANRWSKPESTKKD